MSKFKIGDRVIYKEENPHKVDVPNSEILYRYDCESPGLLGEKAIIITLPEDFPHRVEVKFLDLSNVRGTNMVWWCSIYDIELDREWYREMKLKEIGII